jgi:NADP oxidoreductase coenzyme F420-dependent
MRCASPLSPHVNYSALSRLPRVPRRCAAMASASSSPRLGFLGAGMMAEALAKGFDKAGVARASDMVATDINAERMAVFAGASPFRALFSLCQLTFPLQLLASQRLRRARR